MKRALVLLVIMSCGPSTKPAAKAPVNGAIVARADGVGPLTGQAVTLEQLQAMFPGHDVAFVAADPDDETGEDHFEVKQGGRLLLEIAGDRVTIDDAGVDTEMGVHVGDTHAAVEQSSVGTLTCEDGGEYGDSSEGFVFCRSARYPHYSFDFMDKDEEGYARTMGSELLEDESLLAGATLDRMVWSP